MKKKFYFGLKVHHFKTESINDKDIIKEMKEEVLYVLKNNEDTLKF